MECCQCYIAFEETAVLVEKNFKDAPPKAGIKFSKFIAAIGDIHSYPHRGKWVEHCMPIHTTNYF